jgi:hypothetical protein
MAAVSMHPLSPAPELVGREAEQQALALAIDSVAAGNAPSGRVVLLSGEPGIGKSSLARWAASRAAEAGLPVHWGFAWEAGGAPPYWPWTQCLRALLESNPSVPAAAPALRQLLPELAPGEAPDPARLEPEQARFQLLESVRALLADRAASQPFMLVLEDLHAADRESLFLLQHVCQHAAQSGFVLLGTFRELEAQLTDESSPLWRCARESLVLHLQGLSAKDVDALLRSRDGQTPSLSRVEAILDATEGNPLYLNELLALPPGTASGAPVVPGNLQQVIRRHLETLPALTFEALAAASVLGREFDTDTLAALTQRDLGELEQILEPAVRSSLLRAVSQGVWRFAHLFHREVLYASLDPDTRRVLHLRRAAGLEAMLQAGYCEAWAELAEHFLAAGPDHRRQAVEAWCSAARRAAERLAFTESASLFSRALETFGAGPADEPSERCELQLQTACARLRAGEIDRGRDLCREAFRLASTLDDPLLMARSALAYGTVFQIGKVDTELVRILRSSLAALDGAGARGDSADAAARPRLLARLAAALQPAPKPGEPVAMAFQAVELARETRDRRTLFETLTSAISALMDFAAAEDRLPLTREYAELAEAFDDVPAQFRAHSLLVIDGVESGDPDLIESATTRCGQLADRIDLPHYRWRYHSARALQAMIRGQLEEAERQHGLARAEAQRTGDRVAETTLAIQAFGLLVEHEVTDASVVREAHAAISRAFAASGADDIFVRPLVARQYLRLGDAETALAVCTPDSVSRLLGMPETCNTQVLGDCAILSGDNELARAVYRVLDGARVVCGHSGLYGMTWNGPLALTRARLARALGQTGQARKHYEEALRVARRMTAGPLEAAIRTEAGADGPAAVPREPAAGRVVELTEEGEFWRVRFGSDETAIKDSKGMRILARLLAEPDREFHALDLNDPAGTAIVETGLDEAGSGGLDRTAREAYRSRLADIEEALEEARERNDPGRVEVLLEEQDALQRELSRAYGLGGRRRASGTAAERARVNVTRRLRDAIARIGEQLPEAGRYLDTTVKTGTYCKYTAL